MIACEVMFVEQRAGGSQGSSVWLVQLVLHRLCSNEQTLFHPFSLVGCQGCCKLSFLPSLSHQIPTTENLTPPKVMPWGYRKLLKDDLNGDAAFNT